MNTALNSLWATGCPIRRMGITLCPRAVGRNNEPGMSHDTPILQTESLASSRVEECEKTNMDAHYIPESEPNTYITYLILIIATCTAEETEALESFFSNAHGCIKVEAGDPCQLSAWGHQSLCLPIPPQGNRCWARRFCWILRQRIEGKHLSFQREEDQER